MKTSGLQRASLTFVAAIVMAFATTTIFAQDTNAFGQYDMPAGAPTETPPAPVAAATASSTPLSPADMQILQLAQAKIGDSTIIAYIQNSGTVYGLDASQIVYLKQQGVSETVISAMLNQPMAVAAAAAAVAQQQQQQQTLLPDNQAVVANQQTVQQPSTPPPSTLYIVPDSQTYNYNNWASSYYYPGYPYYTIYAPVGVYWGRGWHGYYGGRFHR